MNNKIVDVEKATKESMKTNTLKIITMGLQDEVYKAMAEPGFTAEALARKFRTEGKKISAQSIRKFIRKTKKAQQQLIRKDLQTAKEVKKLTMDYTKTIRNILDEVQEVKDTAKSEKDMITFNQMIDKLYKGIELIAKLTGELKPNKTTDITIIYQQIDDDIENEMKSIRKKIRDTENFVDIDYEVEQEDKKVAKFIQRDE